MEQLIYFASAHTAKGYQDLLASNLSGIDYIFLIEGATKHERSHCIRHFFEKWRAKGEQIELLLNCLDRSYFTGVINRRRRCAIIDRSAHPHYTPIAVGLIEHIVDLSGKVDEKSCLNDRVDIQQLYRQQREKVNAVHQSFAIGLDIHDQLEQIFIDAIDFRKADHVAQQLIGKLFDHQMSNKATPTVHHRFLGASTATGVTDYIDQLTEQVNKRYLIKGRAGSGKSTLLNKVVAEAEERRFTVECYHCGFDPDSLDMVIIRELNTAIFDSTAPHEYQPSRHGDEIIDLYQTTIAPGTDEKYHEQIASLTVQYKYHIQDGIRGLADVLEIENTIEKKLKNCLDQVHFNQQVETFIKQVETWIHS
ncbi:hypothetical protein [Amphibacillus cookii]|uniref:hypothetical protein n=1 Tax=Amphibacillus cookii TaxID=767787 RepID=UPI0019561DBC|nr:hypothetical protein [Amphibacillus cookii]MBM7539908.1 hypothetical protein [Amphibacillus cookii]